MILSFISFFQSAAHGTGALVHEYAKLMKLIEKYNDDVPFFFVFENVKSMHNECRS